ncbi:hypothetical protein IT775_07580 [Thalassobius aquimarinus]|uniref:DUF2946 domain-containing protein n=1 Tax=Thalassovita aquimarina TaxID=2785917 RepID=A0ABS5HQ86_9RHOB|nr:hypothetical protein [Thalassovita aquimarina]
MRPYVALLLALMLTLTGQSMAVARGMPNAAGEIVLCAGSGPISVLVDEDGQPVGRPHICPDCALSIFAFHDQPPVHFTRPLGQAITLRIDTGRSMPVGGAVPAIARGPPVLF